MALRFRRSLKLGKGMRMNVSKRGVGMSFGTKGMRQSFHSTGRGTQTIGIPGTGLSYVKQKKLSHKRPAKGGRTSHSTGQSVSQNEAAVEEYQNYIYGITHLHLDAPLEMDWETIRGKPEPFEPGEIGPEEAEATAELEAYRPNLLERLIKPLADKHEQEMQQAIYQARERDTTNLEEWEKWRDLAERVLEGQPKAYVQGIEENPAFAEVRKRGLSLVVPHAGAVEAEIQVAPGEIVPKKKLSLTKTGRVSKRKMGKTEYYKIMKDFVCGYTLWVSRALFAGLPIDSCVIHVSENRLNTATGHRKNKVLLSVRIDQHTLNQLRFEKVDPSVAMENFEHHINHLKTKGFRPVKRLKM